MEPGARGRDPRTLRRAHAAGGGATARSSSSGPSRRCRSSSRKSRSSATSIRQLAFQTRTTLLFGSDQIERPTPPRYYNAAFLVEPDGTVAAVYRKMHLVPFGEYVPLKRLLFFAGPLVQAVSDFSAGDRMVMLPVAGRPVSTAICYEVVYPDLARRATLAGQPAADDDHERRVVRLLVGAVAALRDGVDARDRAGPVPGARREHRDQRDRGSVRPRAGAGRRCSSEASVVGEVRFLTGADDLRAGSATCSRTRAHVATLAALAGVAAAAA